MKSFGIVAHLYYHDKVDYLFDLIENINDTFDLFLTTSEDCVPFIINRAESSKNAVKIFIVENKGRDIAPFIYVLNNENIEDYEIVLKVHIKKSTHLSLPERLEWMDRQYRYNVGDKKSFLWIKGAFNELPSVGMIFHESVSMLSNRDVGKNPLLNDYAKKFGVAHLINQPWNFSAGSIFYFRGNALNGLKELKISTDMFEEENGQLDGTLAHSIERLFPLFVKKEGYGVLSADYPQIKIKEIKKRIKKMAYSKVILYSKSEQINVKL